MLRGSEAAVTEGGRRVSARLLDFAAHITTLPEATNSRQNGTSGREIKGQAASQK